MKKILLGVATIGVMVATPLLAGATSIITLASTTPTDLLAYAGTLFTDLWLIIAVAVGIPLAFYIIKKAISLIPKR
jgi:hypothetical protein